ncbi:uncharacterized protein LOC136025417 isoform X2 [Artemia franciscana]
MKAIAIIVATILSVKCSQNIDRVLNSIPKTSFTCLGKGNGYFADIEARCQTYHLCDDSGRQYTYLCPNQTLFNQRMLICDHWYQVECSSSVRFYNKNDLIGNRAKNFLNDDENLKPSNRVQEGSSFPDHLAGSNFVASQSQRYFRLGQPDSSGIEKDLISSKPTEPPTEFTASNHEATHTTTTSNIVLSQALSKEESSTLNTHGAFDDVQAERITLTKILSPKLSLSEDKKLFFEKTGATTIIATTVPNDTKDSSKSKLSSLKTTAHPQIVETTAKTSITNIDDYDDEYEEYEDESESHEDIPKEAVSLFDTEINETTEPRPGTLEYEIISIVDAYTNEQLQGKLETKQNVPSTLESEFVSILDAYNDQLKGTLGFTDDNKESHDHELEHHHHHEHNDHREGNTHEHNGHAHGPQILALLDMRRIFFIPVEDHTMPNFEKDVINVKLNDIDEGPTMKFDRNRFFLKAGRSILLNPQCPQCHPSFLQPGQCIPCVVIR